MFPGIFNRSTFTSNDTLESLSLQITRPDGSKQIHFAGHLTNKILATSLFSSLDEAANFFSLGATGYSATWDPDHFHGMELYCLKWSIEPLAIEHASSAFYDDRNIFPAGTVELDSALVMRNIPHEWHSRPDLYVGDDGSGLTKRCTRRLPMRVKRA